MKEKETQNSKKELTFTGLTDNPGDKPARLTLALKEKTEKKQ